MSKPPILTQLYWPERYRSSHGYLLGWSIRGLICTVIAVLNEPISLLESRLSRVEPRPEVLGIVAGTDGREEGEVAGKKSVADLWYTVEVVDRNVRLLELSCCGYRYRITAHIIYYDSSSLCTHPYNLIWPLRLRIKDLSGYSVHRGEKTDLRLVCDSINQADLTHGQIMKALEIEPKPATKKESQGLERIVEEIVMLFASFLDLFDVVYRWRLPRVDIGLRDVPFHSYFGEHIHTRMEEMRQWRENYRTRELLTTSPLLAKQHLPNYLLGKKIQYKVIFDFLIGLTVLCVLFCYQESTLELVHVLGSGIHIEVLKSEVKWLMGLPAGFKPNVALDGALGSSILIFIDYWNHITTFLTGFEPDIVRVLGVFGTFGASFQLTLLADLVTFCSIHVYYIYRLVSGIFFLQMDVMLSLFRLTMGYKKNVLKNRVDKAEFGVDEVLLGTLIFTGLIFLLPTIAMYYLAFVGIWLGIVLLRLILRLVYTTICFFPYHLLSVYLRGSFLFPGGVYFTLLEQPARLQIPTHYMQMKAQKYPVGLIFEELGEEYKKLLKPLPALLGDVLRGKDLKPIAK